MWVPVDGNFTTVDGGYIPFSLTRADAFSEKNQVKNIWQALIKILPNKVSIKTRKEGFMTGACRRSKTVSWTHDLLGKADPAEGKGHRQRTISMKQRYAL